MLIGLLVIPMYRTSKKNLNTWTKVALTDTISRILAEWLDISNGRWRWLKNDETKFEILKILTNNWN